MTTDALDVAVREEPLVRDAEGRDHRPFVDVAFFLEGEEDFLDPLLVVRVRGVPVEVVLDAELFDVLRVEGVVSFRDDAWRDSLLVREDHRRGAVHVGAADHQDLIPDHAVVTRDDVRGDERRDGVPKVSRARGVRPCDADEDSHFVRPRWEVLLKHS